MPTRHTIKAGECLSSITKKYGFADYKTIYNDPLNAEFKTKHPNPNIIHDGDVIMIPDKKLKELPISTEKRHPFKINREKTFVHLQIKDSKGKPYANVKYKLTVGDNKIEGTTDGDGKVEQEVFADAGHAELFLFSETGGKKIIGAIPLELGMLEPVEDTVGVQARLNNLGFDCGAVDGVLGGKTKAAVKAFQGKNGLTVTGDADAATRNKLQQMHDWE